MIKGKLYGIGIGPGDPELLTLKAINTMKKCHIIATPMTGEGNSVALNTIKDYITDKEVVSIYFSMEKEKEKRLETRKNAAEKICDFLEKGKDVGFVTLGDPSIYSTYMYVHKIVNDCGFETKIIPGIASFCAVSAALNTSLCEDDEILSIIPASYFKDVDEILNIKGNKIIMKSGKNIMKIINRIKERGLSKNTQIVEFCNMDEEKIFKDINEYDGSSYLSTILIKEKN